MCARFRAPFLRLKIARAKRKKFCAKLFPYTGNAYLVGITGAPGTGKSTLVDRLAGHYRSEKKTVGIIAVDPSSPFTGGAILGDRVRMQGHATDSGIFIRSMATRGYLGGLAQATGDTALLLDAAGKQMILVETVGVGQGEIEIVRLADCTIVVLVPGMGDDVQSLKAGLMEIGDIFVINKSDREGADRFEQQLRGVLGIVPEREGWKPPIVRTIATENKGIDDLAHANRALPRAFRSGAGAPRPRSRALEGMAAAVAGKRAYGASGRRAHMNEAQFEALAADVASSQEGPLRRGE